MPTYDQDTKILYQIAGRYSTSTVSVPFDAAAHHAHPRAEAWLDILLTVIPELLKHPLHFIFIKQGHSADLQSNTVLLG